MTDGVDLHSRSRGLSGASRVAEQLFAYRAGPVFLVAGRGAGGGLGLGLGQLMTGLDDPAVLCDFGFAGRIGEVLFADGTSPVFAAAVLGAGGGNCRMMRHRMAPCGKRLNITKGCVAACILTDIGNRAFRGTGRGNQYLLIDVRLLGYSYLVAGFAASGGNGHCVCAGLFRVVIGFDGVRNKLGGDIFAAALQGHAKSVQRQGLAVEVTGFDILGIKLDAHGLYQANGVAGAAAVGQIANVHSDFTTGKVGCQIGTERPAGFQITKLRIA